MTSKKAKPEPREKWVAEIRGISGDIFLANVATDTRPAAESNGRATWGTRFIRVVRFVEAE